MKIEININASDLDAASRLLDDISSDLFRIYESKEELSEVLQDVVKDLVDHRVASYEYGNSDPGPTACITVDSRE